MLNLADLHASAQIIDDRMNMLQSIVDAMSRACLDHGCDLHGWDGPCNECTVALLLNAYHETNQETTTPPTPIAETNDG